jgi:dTDP-4-amino-4,6-dideoxygalactose transaminase
MYCVRTAERDRLAAALSEAQIGFASYYQPPLHLQPALRYLGYKPGDLPETERSAQENLCLPMWGGISEEQQAEVVAVLRRASSLVKA